MRFMVSTRFIYENTKSILVVILINLLDFRVTEIILEILHKSCNCGGMRIRDFSLGVITNLNSHGETVSPIYIYKAFSQGY